MKAQKKSVNFFPRTSIFSLAKTEGQPRHQAVNELAIFSTVLDTTDGAYWAPDGKTDNGRYGQARTHDLPGPALVPGT